MDESQANGRLSPTEVTALITLIDARLGRTEDRIIARLDLNSAAATESWRKHDLELAENTKRVVARFVLLEKSLDEHLQVANVHFAADHDARVTADARSRPIKGVAHFLVANWIAIALLIISTLAILGILGAEWRALT